MAVLQIENLKKSFVAPDHSVQTVIDIPGFSLESGQLLGLRGRSGTGKTTFLNLINGILRHDSGRVLIDSCDMTALTEAGRDRLRAEKLGNVFQNFLLIQGMTALENVMLGMVFGRGADELFARRLLADVGLADRFHHYPSQLSTGQQQRVGIARALAGRPRIVLADEPTGNLDPVQALKAVDSLIKLCRSEQAALLLVSHDEEILCRLPKIIDLAEVNQATGMGSDA